MSVRKRSNAEWRVLVEECETSGKTQEEWCLANGINYYTYKDRARRLREMDEREENGPIFRSKAKRGWVEVKESGAEQAVEVKPVVTEPERRPVGPNHGEIHIIIGSFTVAVRDDFNEAVFIRILKALSAARDAREAAHLC